MFTKSSTLLAGITALALSGSALMAAESPNGNTAKADAGQGEKTKVQASQEGQKASGCPNFVDANGNGVCDRKEQGSCPGGQGWGRGQGRGAGQGLCRGAGQCKRFVDENKNGVCDRKEQDSCPRGQGWGRGQGRGACRGFGGGRGGGQAGSAQGANANPQETGR